MKKILLLILVVVMSFTLAACGGGENDENNAAMQAKLDEADSLVQDICNWYEENGYLEGDTATAVQSIIDTLQGQIEEIKEQHQQVLDMGGFTDEDVAALGPLLDDSIAEYKKGIEKQAAYDESAAAGTRIAPLVEKYNQLYDIVMEASALATANGWDEDEAYTSELEATLKILEVTKADLDNLESLDEAYKNEISSVFEEMIPVWQGYLTQVAEPYETN